jgi:hypothetical protein
VLGVFGGIEEESDIDEDAQDRCQVGVERRHGVGLLSLHVWARGESFLFRRVPKDRAHGHQKGWAGAAGSTHLEAFPLSNHFCAYVIQMLQRTRNTEKSA